MRFPGGEVPNSIGYILEWMKKYGLLIERAFSMGRLRQDPGGGAVVGPPQTHTHDGTTQGGDLWTKGADLPSAATLAVGVAGHYFHVTGATTITAIASRPAGVELILEFDAALTITHGASLILANATNIVTAAGDVIRFTSEGGGTWRQSSYTLKTAGTVLTATISGDLIAPPGASLSEIILTSESGLTDDLAGFSGDLNTGDIVILRPANGHVITVLSNSATAPSGRRLITLDGLSVVLDGVGTPTNLAKDCIAFIKQPGTNLKELWRSVKGEVQPFEFYISFGSVLESVGP